MEQQLPVYPKFTKEMKHTHKILIPNMLPIHWTLLRDALEDEGYDAEVLTTTGPEIAQEGLDVYKRQQRKYLAGRRLYLLHHLCLLPGGACAGPPLWAFAGRAGAALRRGHFGGHWG